MNLRLSKPYQQDLGIPVRADLPVGYSMQSHVGPSEPAFLVPDRSLTYDYARYVATPHHWRDYLRHGAGPLATPASFEAMLFGKTGFNNESWPDFQIYFMSTHLGTDAALVYAEAQNVNFEQVRLSPLLMCMDGLKTGPQVA